jgi:hypothetical protein
MSDDPQRAPRSQEEAKMMREAQANALKAARERGLRGKAFEDFAASIGLSRTDAFRMIRRDHPDRGFGAREG